MPATSNSFVVKLDGPLGDKAVLRRARVDDRLSTLTRTVVEFMTEDPNLDLERVLAKPHTLAVTLSTGDLRKMHGLCTEVEFLRTHGRVAFYRAVLHPFAWLLTRTTDNRIFQEKTTIDIIKEVFGDHGLSAQLQDKTSQSYEPREYCVQYNETDFAFVSRLMEEEGIYYFFEHAGQSEKMVLADGPAAHLVVSGMSRIPYDPEDALDLDEDHFTDFRGGDRIVSGKVSLNDYTFKAPSSDLRTHKTIKSGEHPHAAHELYGYPGRYRESGLGEKRARVRMEGAAAESSRWRAAGSVRQAEVGRTFTLERHDRSAWNREYMIVSCLHEIADDVEARDPERLPGADGTIPTYSYHADIEVMEKSEQFRAPQVTPWPDMSGVHVATVVGKAGEEIWTDEYGRVNVHFHWDRLGAKDENASCWVRVASPWAGKGWGWICVPRIGSECIVQFEDGNPDRPIVTGTLYNAEWMPPYGLPSNQTMQGLKTRSTKGGGSDTFNELVFEDKKGSECVRFQSERDYEQIVKNNADITIGMEHQDKGDLTETIHRHKTQTLKTGDHTFTIADGNQKIDIKKNQTETISGASTRTVSRDVKETYKANLTQTVTDNVTEKIERGNYSQTLGMGNHSTKLDMGSVKFKVSMGSVSRKVLMGSISDKVSLGNITHKCSVGKITQKAMQGITLDSSTKITLKCGTSKIEMTPMGITLEGMMINVKAQTILDMKGMMIKGNGSAMVQIQGGVVMVN